MGLAATCAEPPLGPERRVGIVEQFIDAIVEPGGVAELEGGLQIVRLGGLGQLRQSGEDFLFREVDVLQRVVKQVVECLRFLGHDWSPLG